MNTKSIKIFQTKILILTVFLAAIINYSKCQTNVTYIQQTGDYDQNLTTTGSGGIYNNGSTEIGMWMDGDNSSNSYAGNVLWKTFRVGSSTSNSIRNLNIGDEFVITVSTKGFYYGTIGVSLNSGSLPSATWANRISNSRIRVQQDGLNFGGGTPGSWYYSGTSAGSFNITPTGSYVNYEIRVKIISQDRCNISVNGTWIYDVELGGTSGAAITHYSIYMSDDRAGIWSTPNRGNSYWKQSTILQNTGNMNFGSSNTSFSITEALTNGLDANSTSANSLNNSLTKSGSGTLTLAGSNVYAGATTISTGTLKLAVSSSSSTSGPLGTTAAGTTVSSGAVLDLNGHSLTSSASEALTLNGYGISHGGALINSSSTASEFIGAITLGTESRVNATTGNITLSGNINGGSNSLYVGGSNNTSISGIISGAGGGTDGSLFKDGSGTLTLSGANDYTGDTRITGGNLTVNSGGSLGDGSDVFISSGANVNINTNTTVASIQETANSNGGVVAIGNGATLTINGSNKGTMFQNSISGQGGLTMSGSGNSMLSLYGSQTYTGATTLSGGALDIPVSTTTSGVTVSGGNLYVKNNSALGSGTLTLSGGTLDVDAARTITNAMSIGGNFTFTGTNSLTQTTGGITLTTSPTVTVSANTLSLGGVISGSNGVTKSGSGTMTFGGLNTYTGATTISAGTLKLDATSSSSSSGPLGTTAAGTTVSSGAVLDLNGNSLSGSAAEALTLNGTGISDGGALINSVNATVTYMGNISLGSSSRINATQGTIQLSGNIAGSNNVLYLGGSGNTNISGVISGSGNTQNGTITSVYKNNSGTLTLSGANDYTGDTRITEGNLTVNSGGSLGNGSDVFISSGANVNINTNTTVASVQETGNSNGGSIAIGSGATLTVNGADKSTLYQNSISGAGGLTLAASGTTNLSLYGTQNYTGATHVSGGTLSIPVSTTTSGITLSGGTLNLNHNSAAGSGTLTLTGGTLNVDAARTISNAMSIGGNFTFTGTNSLTQTSGGITLAATPTITVSASTLSLGGAIGGSFGITKSGSGTLALAGVNTYSGLTTVSAGTLHINASGGCIPSANDIAVSGGTLRVSYDQTIDDLTATSGSIEVDAGKTLTVNGKLSISNGVTINLNSTGKIAYGANADLEFTGSATISDAVWPSTAGPTDIIVNGSGITVTLDKNRTISGNMTMTSGVLSIGNFDLTVSGTLTGGSSTAYINTGGTGKLIRPIATATQLTYPVGNGAYSPITLNFASGTFGSATASVKVAATKHPSNIAATSYIRRYWDVTQSGISSFSCNVSCTYQQSDVAGTESHIYAGKYSGSTWTLGSAADVTNNILLFNNATSFSDFTGGELSAMPVHWLFHHCKPHSGKVQLTWGVSEEPATGIYTIERSAEGSIWKPLGTKTPHGPSFTPTTYQFADAAPLTQNFYRIQYTENNGDKQYSEICHAQILDAEKPVINTNADGSEIMVAFGLQSEYGCTLTLFDATGRKLKTKTMNGKTGRIATADLPAGIYELLLESAGYKHAQRVILTR